MFEEYEQVRVINLPERADRRREMTVELRSVGLGERAIFTPAVKPETSAPWSGRGERGCFLSHLAILEAAAEKNESVLILEDDCDFTRFAREPRPKSDLLWGGYTLFPNYIVGSHCMGLSATAAQRCASYFKQLLDHPKPPPVDGCYAWFCRDNRDLVVDACNPMIAVQRPSFSDIAGRRGLDRFPAARSLLAALRVIKRAAKRYDTSAGGSFEELMATLRKEKAARSVG